MNRIEALTVFAKVAELGSISGAAQALRLPKASVSRAVTGLESDYGVSLVERSTRGIVLTEAGQKLQKSCERLLKEMEAVEVEMANYRGEPSGRLRVGCAPTVAGDLAESMPQFLERYPAIELRLKVGDRLFPEPGGIDVVLHAGWLADSALIAVKLTELPTILVASRGYVTAHGAPGHPSELDRHRVVGVFYAENDRITGGAEQLPAFVPPLELMRGSERHPVQSWSGFASNHPQSVVEVVRQGVAITPMPLFAVKGALLTGDLVHILPEYEIAVPPALYAVCGSLVVPPKVRVFIDFVREKVNERLARASR